MNTNHLMNTGKDYSTMIREQYGSLRLVPIWSGWEFMARRVQSTTTDEINELEQLMKQGQWQLTAELRQALGRRDQAVVVTDHRRVIQYVNKSFVRMTGYKAKEIVGRRPDFLQGAGTDPATRLRIRTALASAQPAQETLLNYRQDGTPYWCDITIFPVLNSQQELVNFVAFEQEINRQ